MSTRSRQNLKFLVECKVIRDHGPGQNNFNPSERVDQFTVLGVKRSKWQNGRVSSQLTQQEEAHFQDDNLYEGATSVVITAHNCAVAVKSDVTIHGVPNDTIWGSIGFDDSRTQIRVQYGATESYYLCAGQNSTWSRLIPPNHIDGTNTSTQGSRPLAGALAVIIGLAALSNPAAPDATLASGFQTQQATGVRYWAPVTVQRRGNIGVVVRIYTYNTPPASAGSSREELKSLSRGNGSLGPIFDL